MDIEKLTKMQIVLLTLLVSFVTSIATGIVTVTLMDQAPPAITQTLNRVVERTVERVVPNESQSASVITKETTVVVKEEDLITDSINKNSKSVVKIKEIAEDGRAGVIAGIGVIVSKDGIVATDQSVLKGSSKYIVETSNGQIFKADVVILNESEPSVFLSIDVSEENEKPVFSPANLSNSDLFKLGQTVISLTGENRINVAIGIISGLIEENIVIKPPIESTDIENSPVGGENPQTLGEEKKTITILSAIKTSIDKKDVIAGSPLINIFGEVVGISFGSLSNEEKTALFTPAKKIKNLLLELNKKDKNYDATI